MKFQIQRELRAKPKPAKEAKGSKYTPRLTEWLVRTILLVSAEEYSDGSIHRSASGKMAVSPFSEQFV